MKKNDDIVSEKVVKMVPRAAYLQIVINNLLQLLLLLFLPIICTRVTVPYSYHIRERVSYYHLYSTYLCSAVQVRQRSSHLERILCALDIVDKVDGIVLLFHRHNTALMSRRNIEVILTVPGRAPVISFDVKDGTHYHFDAAWEHLIVQRRDVLKISLFYIDVSSGISTIEHKIKVFVVQVAMKEERKEEKTGEKRERRGREEREKRERKGREEGEKRERKGREEEKKKEKRKKERKWTETNLRRRFHTRIHFEVFAPRLYLHKHAAGISLCFDLLCCRSFLIRNTPSSLRKTQETGSMI